MARESEVLVVGTGTEGGAAFEVELGVGAKLDRGNGGSCATRALRTWPPPAAEQASIARWTMAVFAITSSPSWP